MDDEMEVLARRWRSINMAICRAEDRRDPTGVVELLMERVRLSDRVRALKEAARVVREG